MSLTTFLMNRGFVEFEGNCNNVPQQMEHLIQLTSTPNINMMEIGFNAGHSADLFLKNNLKLSLTSFDLGIHDYISTSKSYIDFFYPERHKLILGDSRETVPRFISENKDVKFDVIFIDGGHEYDIATKDIQNCFHLAHKDTLVILDDTMFTSSGERDWTIGPTRAWIEHIQKNMIVELGHADYTIGRGMAWGKYII